MFDQYMPKVDSRAAVEGEELVVHRFHSGVSRMVSTLDFERWLSAVASLCNNLSQDVQPTKRLWRSIKNSCVDFLKYYGFIDLDQSPEPGPVVKIPTEALLRVYGISTNWQKRYTLRTEEDALFIELLPVSDPARYALCFGNGAVIPLPQLPEGQKVRVLRRSWAESLEPEPALVHTK